MSAFLNALIPLYCSAGGGGIRQRKRCRDALSPPEIAVLECRAGGGRAGDRVHMETDDAALSHSVAWLASLPISSVVIVYYSKSLTHRNRLAGGSQSISKCAREIQRVRCQYWVTSCVLCPR